MWFFKLVHCGSISQNLLEPLAHACDMCGYIKVHPQYGYPVGSRYSLSLPSFMVHSAAVSALGCTEHASWCLITRVLMKARIRNCLVTLLLTLNYKTLIEQNDQSCSSMGEQYSLQSVKGFSSSINSYSSNGVLRILANNGIFEIIIIICTYRGNGHQPS